MTSERPQETETPFPHEWRRIGDVLRDPAMWQDLEQAPADALEGSDIVVHDVIFLPSTNEAMPGDFAICLITRPEDGKMSETLMSGAVVPQGAMTTGLGGGVVVRKLKQLAGVEPEAASALPLMMRLVKQRNRANTFTYWDIR